MIVASNVVYRFLNEDTLPNSLHSRKETSLPALFSPFQGLKIIAHGVSRGNESQLNKESP